MFTKLLRSSSPVRPVTAEMNLHAAPAQLAIEVVKGQQVIGPEQAEEACTPRAATVSRTSRSRALCTRRVSLLSTDCRNSASFLAFSAKRRDCKERCRWISSVAIMISFSERPHRVL